MPTGLHDSELGHNSGVDRRRILLMSIGILTVVSIIVGSLALFVLYRAAVAEEQARLREVVESRARIIEAVARFDARHLAGALPGEAEAATLGQIAEAHEGFEGFGETGEFTLARRDGDRIVFLLRHRHGGAKNPRSILFDSKLAEPMRRALRGESGTVVGLDYREAVVLAAHEPVQRLGWGVVAKIDLDEIRAPFLRAALQAGGLGVLVIALGAVAIVRLSSPLIRRIDERTRQLHSEMAERSRVETELAKARTLLIDALEEPHGLPSDSAGEQATRWRYYRAVAVDYDGTLTEGGRPSEEVLAALREARSEGRVVVLATGRILAELRHEFLDVDDWFDLIVAENGAVISRGNAARAIAAPISSELDAALRNRGIAFRRGHVLLACDGRHDGVVLEELTRLGLDCQIVRNRGALMVLPAGVSKGSGLSEALGTLGISAHSTIAVGDAENDLSLLEECELGVAVANGIDSLKARADLVLAEPAAAGVTSLLRGPILGGEKRVESKRWRVDVGFSAGNQAVAIPASQVNVLITGATTGGKSYAAGLLAEQLIALKYSVCILDPEGDHVSLGLLRGVTVLGATEPLLSAEQLGRVIRGRPDSLVLDMSLLSPAEKEAYITQALHVLRRHRVQTGLPHWIFVDEAHVPLADDAVRRCFEPGERGYCLVTYRPAVVCRETKVTIDFLLLVASGRDAEPEVIESVSALTGISPAALGRFLGASALGKALLVRLGEPPKVDPLILGPRAIRHVRHWHKYGQCQLPAPQRFYFRDSSGETGSVAGNLEELHRELRVCEDRVLAHHARGGDLSRWLQDVMKDATLAAKVRGLEKQLTRAREDGAVSLLRHELLHAIEKRYLE